MGVEAKCYGVAVNGNPDMRRCPDDVCFEDGDPAYRQGHNNDLRYYCVNCAKKLNKI